MAFLFPTRLGKLSVIPQTSITYWNGWNHGCPNVSYLPISGLAKSWPTFLKKIAKGFSFNRPTSPRKIKSDHGSDFQTGINLPARATSRNAFRLTSNNLNQLQWQSMVIGRRVRHDSQLTIISPVSPLNRSAGTLGRSKCTSQFGWKYMEYEFHSCRLLPQIQMAMGNRQSAKVICQRRVNPYNRLLVRCLIHMRHSIVEKLTKSIESTVFTTRFGFRARIMRKCVFFRWRTVLLVCFHRFIHFWRGRWIGHANFTPKVM